MPRTTTIALLTALAAPVFGAWAVGVGANAARAEDRYGPPRPVAVSPQAVAPASGWLTWSTKTSASNTAETIGPAPGALARAAPPERTDRVAAVGLPTSLYSAPASARQAPAPWTSTGRAAATATPTAAQTTANQPPRFYSVHREFGLKPDPIPLPQQFFADSAADLAAPPPPLAPHPVPGTQAATSPLNTAANRAREVDLETADSAAN